MMQKSDTISKQPIIVLEIFKRLWELLEPSCLSPRSCIHCNAHLFYHESLDMYCFGGKISFPQVNGPQELLEIFMDSSTEGNHFRKHIRCYNHVFSFTLCGVHIDERLAYKRILSRAGFQDTFLAIVHIWHRARVTK